MSHTPTKNNGLTKWSPVPPPAGLAERIMAAVLTEPPPNWQSEPVQGAQPTAMAALVALALAAANLCLLVLAPLQLLQLRNLWHQGLLLAELALQWASLVWQGAVALIEPFTSTVLLVTGSLGQPLAQVVLQLLTTNVAGIPLIVLPLLVSIILLGQVFVLAALWPSSNQ